MSATRNGTRRFKVGDWVSFPYGTRNLIAQVIEDRGPLGINRRRIYRVLVDREPDEPDSFEMPEDDLATVPPPDRAAVKQYLKNGGLLAILRSHLCEKRDQPRVWLTYTPRGAVTHTFSPERGVIGGARVPFFALHEEKVGADKMADVLSLLERLGRSGTDAEEILAAVGIAD